MDNVITANSYKKYDAMSKYFIEALIKSWLNTEEYSSIWYKLSKNTSISNSEINKITELFQSKKFSNFRLLFKNSAWLKLDEVYEILPELSQHDKSHLLFIDDISEAVDHIFNEDINLEDFDNHSKWLIQAMNATNYRWNIENVIQIWHKLAIWKKLTTHEKTTISELFDNSEFRKNLREHTGLTIDYIIMLQRDF